MSHTLQLEQHYLQYHLQLLQAFVQQIERQQPFVSDMCSDDDREFLFDLKSLYETKYQSPEFLYNGQLLLCRVVTSYSHLMPLLYRDLLWFFGGDCLHFMPDDEIARYQRLDELRHECARTEKEFSYGNERAKLFGLH